MLAERGLRRGHVRLDMLPPYLVQAVLSTEDRRFYAHFGIDPLGLVRASFRNASAGTVVEGGSTITQQLAKNLFLSPQAHRHAQAGRGGLRGLARAALLQGRDPRALSQPRLFRRRHLRGRGRLAPLFRQVVALRHAVASGAARGAAEGALALRADAQRQGRQRARRRGARQHGRGGLPLAGAGAQCQPAAAQALRQGRRHRLSLSSRLRGRAVARVRRRARRRPDRRDDHRCRAATRLAAGAAPSARRRGRRRRRRRRRGGGARSDGRA